MRLSRKGIGNIKRGLRRSWIDGAHRKRQKSRQIDADTLRKRALHDRRGTDFASVLFRTKIGIKHFSLIWSVSGRTDQLDILDTESGAILATIRQNLILDKLSKICNG